jgi:hypothetical protein
MDGRRRLVAKRLLFACVASLLLIAGSAGWPNH